jgi:hypothetical protein
MAGLLLTAASQAHATVYEMRDYFESLGASYPTQSSSDLWTFQYGDHNGGMLEPSGANYVSSPYNYQQIGQLVNNGDAAAGGYGGAPSYPTFDGVFMHSGASSATAAIFHASEAMNIGEIKLWSETIVNGAAGNGFAVTVNAVISGVTQSIGAFNFAYSEMVETLYTPSTLSLQAGDMIEILYGSNGSYLYDHGNVNAFITSSPITTTNANTNTVPEPSAFALLLTGMVGLLGINRRRSPDVEKYQRIS